MTKRQFGVSTHLYHGQRLSHEHLLEIAAHGFECIEVYATRTHFDYHNPSAIADLQGWLADARLELHSIHAPTAESFAGGRWSGSLSLASPDPAARAHAVSETEKALHVARRLPVPVLVTHLGIPRTQIGPGNSRAAARRSLEELRTVAEPLGVRIAVEVIPNQLSGAGSIVHFVEDDLDGLGICLDFGHAHLDGDVADAVETVSEYLIATHVHDNRGRHDDHLLPFDGTIDWAGTLLAVQKIGYDGPFMFEIVPNGSTKQTLARARAARQRIEAILAEGSAPLG
ncbi:MAG TPA: sugar phosphate isomerase/epimerase family protein [Vicinamibacterales bacterium]|nr:sugar phosphate isomerase/epimerase family protein [Vicinamibacterales bacterium]